MAGRTIFEKILARKSGQDARVGDLVVCAVDCPLGTDGSVPMALDVPATSPQTIELHRLMGDFAKTSISLASPAACEAAATRGVVTDPRKVLR